MFYNNEKSEKLLVTGGHFIILNNEANLNKGTIESFYKAVEHYNKLLQLGKNVEIGLLINDIGTTCNETSCTLISNSISRTNFQLPIEYINILNTFNLNPSDLVIFWEKHIKNRSKKLFNKLIKSNHIIIEHDDESYYHDDEYFGKVTLSRKKLSDKYGSPACPLIMAGLYLEQAKKYTHVINYYYIALENFQNIPNYKVIEKGSKLAQKIGSDMINENIYFSQHSDINYEQILNDQEVTQV